VVSETVDDLTVVPGRLTAAYTVDPTWDRFSNLTTAAIDGQGEPFFLFVGTRRLGHALYFGDDALLALSRPSTIEVPRIRAAYLTATTHSSPPRRRSERRIST
jgi:hypothetical protein